jgi:hypothetical protein
MTRPRIIFLTGKPRRTCYAWFVAAHRELVSSALAVVRGLHGTTVVSASYGTMTPIKIYTTVMIVAYAEKVEVWERTFSIAR